MPDLKFRFNLIRQQLEGDLRLSTSIENPRISRLLSNDTIPRTMLKQLQQVMEKCPGDRFHQFVLPPDIQPGSVDVKVQAPERVNGWSGEFQLPIAFVSWQFDRQVKLAFVPSLGVHVIAVGNAILENEIRREVKSALIRIGATRELSKLVYVARFGEIQIESIEHAIAFPTLKERAQREGESDEQQSTLKKVAQQLFKENTRPSYQLDAPIKQLAEMLTAKQPESVLLVGPAGCGKSSVFNQLVRDRELYNMADFEFWQTDGSRLIAGMSGFGQWQERCSKLIAELSKTKAVIHLGNLIELLEVGRGGGMSHGIADFLRPYLVRGKFLAVAECTPEQLAMIDKQSPQMLDAFQRQAMQPASRTQTGEILLKIADNDYPTGSFLIEPEAVATVNQLHHRYAAYSAMPGRAVRFFRNLIEDAEADSIIDSACVTQAFSDESGLPLFLLNDQQKLDLDAAHAWFSSRIIGQSEPVDLIVNMLATIKANLNRPERPIASMLFLGPTGVGKTEMAKAIAEYMYRDPKRMVRFDMSEFNHPYSGERLIGGFAGNEGLLTSKVRENPFTVVLLDEFEKAHPAVFDLFLQVLGEGRLTDGRGQLVDFSTSIVIMTSNLGVDSFRETGVGFTRSQSADYREHFIKKAQQHVRPEFFNRIDRIVPFAPLSEDAIREITLRELDLLQKRDGISRRNVKMTIDESVVEFLARTGFDPRYGARPLKRTINRQVTWPLSKNFNKYLASAELNANLVAQESGIHFQVSSTQNQGSKQELSERKQQNLEIKELSQQRRRAQAVENSPVSNRIRNELYRAQQTLEQQLRRLPKKQRIVAQYSDFHLVELQQSIEKLQNIHNKIEALAENARQLELQVLEKKYAQEAFGVGDIRKLHEELSENINQLILELFVKDTGGATSICLYLFSRHLNWLKLLTETYHDLAIDKGLGVQLSLLRRTSKQDREPDFVLRPPKQGDEPELSPNVEGFKKETLSGLFDETPGDTIGVALILLGPTSFQLMAGERGVHIFRSPEKETVLVESSGEDIARFPVPDDIANLKTFDQHLTRRIYDVEKESITDSVMEKSFENKGASWQAAIAELVELSFRNRLNELIEVWS